MTDTPQDRESTTEEDLHNEVLDLVDDDTPSAEFVDQEDGSTEAEAYGDMVERDAESGEA